MDEQVKCAAKGETGGMGRVLGTALGYDDVFLQHRTGAHPERPARLTSICEHLKRDGLWERLVRVGCRVEADGWIREVHSGDYIERLVGACEAALPFIDVPDSAICDDSYKVACEAVGAVLGVCDLVMEGEVANGFCAVRPPGHHAEADRSMGFCLFNNVAVAARYLQKRHGLRRVLILDWDVHHGNGTQHIFERDNTVYYCSLHQHPATLFPGTGWPNEMGEGLGRGYTLNLAMEPGAGDGEWLEMFETNFLPAARDFRPEFVLVSAGFDGHRRDPLAQTNLSYEGYRRMSELTVELAREYCGGRLVSILEGGYQLGVLSQCVATHLETMMG